MKKLLQASKACWGTPQTVPGPMGGAACACRPAGSGSHGGDVALGKTSDFEGVGATAGEEAALDFVGDVAADDATVDHAIVGDGDGVGVGRHFFGGFAELFPTGVVVECRG